MRSAALPSSSRISARRRDSSSEPERAPRRERSEPSCGRPIPADGRSGRPRKRGTQGSPTRRCFLGSARGRIKIRGLAKQFQDFSKAEGQFLGARAGPAERAVRTILREGPNGVLHTPRPRAEPPAAVTQSIQLLRKYILGGWIGPIRNVKWTAAANQP